MMARRAGFTLVEVLVSVLVFGLLAAAAYVALDGLSGAAAEHRRHAELLAGLQRTVAMVDADLRQAVSRPVHTGDGLEAALAGGEDGFAVTRAGDVSPQGNGRLRRVAWRTETGALHRLRWSALDHARNDTPARAPVPAPVVGMQVRYRDATRTWHARWPDAGQPPTGLPAAVEYRLELADGTSVRRLVVLK